MKTRILLAAVIAFLGMAVIAPHDVAATTTPKSVCCFLPPPDCPVNGTCN